MVHAHLIGGTWTDGPDARANINPANTDETVGDYAEGSADLVHQAVDAARAAADPWAFATPQQRFDALDFVGAELLARREELGRLLAREEGKSLAESIGEVARAGHIFKFFAGEALRIPGERAESVRPGVEVEVSREPVGIVAAITPWNFPIAIPAWKVAPALAYGNCVVLKPAALTPGCAWAMAEIIARSGLPDGVFNLVMGSGSEVGAALLDADIDAVSFTGSATVGHGVRERAAARGIKVQLEMGGKNPFIVLDDADIPTAVEAAVNGAFFSTGQRCTASSRLIVTAGVHDRFVEALVARMKELKIDDPLKEGTHIGPVVDQRQLDQDLEYLEVGRGEGAELLWGGERLNRDTPGFYLQPALFTSATNDMRICRDEIFGPIAAVIKVPDFEAALAAANDTEFGLSAGIATTSLSAARAFRRRAQAGMVMINLPTAGVDYHVPFGGRKASSYGPREQGRYAVEFYTTVKTAYARA